MMVEFFQGEFHTAKKQHRCDMCGKLIETGERYYYGSGKVDGEFYIIKHCENCYLIENAYSVSTGECEYTDDCVLYWLGDEFCNDCVHGSHVDGCKDDCVDSVFSCKIILDKLRGH